MTDLNAYPYVMVESGQAGTLENSLLPQPIYLTTGEADFTNEQLVELDCSQTHVKLEDDLESQE